MPKLFWGLVLMLAVVVTSSCGGGTSAIRALQINQQLTASGTEFTATATYSDGKQVTPAPVSWIVWNSGTFLKGQPGYRLSSSPYVPLCGSQCLGWTLVVIAPADPNAPMSGPIPLAVFQDLISGKRSTEAGFVAATVQL